MPRLYKTVPQVPVICKRCKRTFEQGMRTHRTFCRGCHNARYMHLKKIRCGVRRPDIKPPRNPHPGRDSLSKYFIDSKTKMCKKFVGHEPPHKNWRGEEWR